MLYPVLQYGFDGLISSAGGYIEYGGEVVYDCPMTPEQQKRVLDIFKESGIYRTIGGRNNSYTDEGFKEFLAENAQSEANSELLRWRIQIESELDIHPMAEYDGEPIYGMAFMSRGAERLEKPMQALQDEFDFCIQDEDACGIVNGELASKAFNKGKAVERLCPIMRISGCCPDRYHCGGRQYERSGDAAGCGNRRLYGQRKPLPAEDRRPGVPACDGRRPVQSV